MGNVPLPLEGRVRAGEPRANLGANGTDRTAFKLHGPCLLGSLRSLGRLCVDIKAQSKKESGRTIHELSI